MPDVLQSITGPVSRAFSSAEIAAGIKIAGFGRELEKIGGDVAWEGTKINVAARVKAVLPAAEYMIHSTASRLLEGMGRHLMASNEYQKAVGAGARKLGYDATAFAGAGVNALGRAVGSVGHELNAVGRSLEAHGQPPKPAPAPKAKPAPIQQAPTPAPVQSVPMASLRDRANAVIGAYMSAEARRRAEVPAPQQKVAAAPAANDNGRNPYVTKDNRTVQATPNQARAWFASRKD